MGMEAEGIVPNKHRVTANGPNKITKIARLVSATTVPCYFHLKQRERINDTFVSSFYAFVQYHSQQPS